MFTLRSAFSLALILSALSVFASCHSPGRMDAVSNSNSAGAGSSSISGSTGSNGAAEEIKIKSSDDRRVVEFKPGGEGLKIEFMVNGQTQVLRGEAGGRSDKRKYAFDGTGIIAEVKPDAEGFKVRTTEGRLLWKVKTSGDKIKISDNEENTDPFVLERKDDDRVKVLHDETEIGEVKFYPDSRKVKIKDTGEKELYESDTGRYSALYGVLLMTQIPERERYIIMAELLARKL